MDGFRVEVGCHGLLEYGVKLAEKYDSLKILEVCRTPVIK